MIEELKLEYGKVYGECIWKKFRITPEWKCVDFRIHSKFSHSERNEILDLCRKRDYFDVCQWCKEFKKL